MAAHTSNSTLRSDGRTLKRLKVKQAKFRAQEPGLYKPVKPLRDVAADQPTGPPLGS